MNMKAYLSITQLGKIKHITTETLRHYDRIGLFTPGYIDPDTRYRYYSLDQIEQIDTILELRDMGMSLGDIRTFMENRDVAMSLKLLSEKETELEKEIAVKRRLLKNIREKRCYIEQMQKEEAAGVPQEWKICHLKESTYVVSKVFRTEMEEYLLDVTMLKQNLRDDTALFFATNNVGSIIRRDSFLDEETMQFERIAAFPEEKCKKQIIDAEKYKMPEGDYLCVTGHALFRFGTEMEKRLKCWIKEQGFIVCGDIIEQDEIDMALTNCMEEVTYSLKIPVKKA